MILQEKVAVIYGAGGAIGSAVSRAFAQEGAKLSSQADIADPSTLSLRK